MALAYVRIDGEIFPASWDGSSAVALGDLKVVWGTKSRYEDPPPASLSLTLIDPEGWVFNTQLQGLAIDVATFDTFSLSSMIFRGRIQTAAPEPATVIHPVTKKPVDVWRVAISAKDPLADLATATLAGPGAGGAWPQQTFSARVAYILAHVQSPQLEEIASTSGHSETVKAYTADDSVNLLDLLRRGWWADTTWIRRLQYVPRRFTNKSGIEPAIVWHNRGLKLYWDGAQLRLDTYGSNDTIVPASKIGLPFGAKFGSSVDTAIDVVQVTSQNAAGDGVLAEVNTSRYGSTTGSVRTLKVDTDIVSAAPLTITANLFREYAEVLNGSWEQPRIRVVYNPNNLDPEFYSASLFIHTWLVDQGWYFAGSRFAAIPGAGGIQQVIGGTLSCDGIKWTHDMTIAPTINTVDTPPVVTIAQLVTNPSATLQDFHPTISMADLGHITEGAF